MAEVGELRRLLADFHKAEDVAERYGGARRRLSGVGFAMIDFTVADEPARRWLEYCCDNPGPDAACADEFRGALTKLVENKP